jgi:hypothetical protein
VTDGFGSDSEAWAVSIRDQACFKSRPPSGLFALYCSDNGQLKMWMAEWTALAARISTLMEAGTFLVRTIASGENDNYGMSDELLRNAGEVVFRISQFRENIGPQLPTSARDCLDRFVTDCENRFGRSDRFPGQASGLPGLQGVLTMLGSFRAEFSYLLAEIEAVGSRLVIRSLKHLQEA